MKSLSRRTGVVVVIALIAALAIGWYAASPRWTLHQMKAAADAGDVETLASYIDFPAVRTSMKEELKAQAVAEMDKQKGRGGLEALGAMFAMSMVDNMVDGMITPATFRKMFAANKAKAPKGLTQVDATAKDIVIERNGLDRFQLLGKSDEAKPGSLIFIRHGLGWKLSGVRLLEPRS